jgi:hypothetical protein
MKVSLPWDSREPSHFHGPHYHASGLFSTAVQKTVPSV